MREVKELTFWTLAFSLITTSMTQGLERRARFHRNVNDNPGRTGSNHGSHQDVTGRTGRARFHHNVSDILDNLLNGYDQKLRPNFGGKPTIVTVHMNIRSMGPVSESDMTYSMDAYFRQSWLDERLAFKGPPDTLMINFNFLNHIWRPDTSFYNGLGSYLHLTTTPNKMVRIEKSGKVFYSTRLTIKATCPMFLQQFPTDRQSCPLQFGSFAYTTEQVLYQWLTKRGTSPIEVSAGLQLSQYDLAGYPFHNTTISRGQGTFSVLEINFKLQRRMGYFLIQVYVPCTLIVILSWVSFWINREATADRVGLGITTVLTLTTLSMDTRDDLPKVEYATALDWFIITCFGFVIGTLLEFAGVHYFTKLDSGEVYHDDSSSEEEDEMEVVSDTEWEDEQGVVDSDTSYGYTNHTTYVTRQRQTQYNSIRGAVNSHVLRDPDGNSYLAVLRRNEAMFNAPVDIRVRYEHLRNRSCAWKFLKCIQGAIGYQKVMRANAHPNGVNSVSKIDRVSRILFPSSFIILNVLYWISYSSDMVSSVHDKTAG